MTQPPKRIASNNAANADPKPKPPKHVDTTVKATRVVVDRDTVKAIAKLRAHA